MTDDTVAPTDTITVSVWGLRLQCWRCRRETVAVVGGLHPAAAPDPLDSFVRCDNGEALATAARMLRDAGRGDLARPIKRRQRAPPARGTCPPAASTATRCRATSSSSTRN